MPDTPTLVTPDSRYLIVRGRLWRRANPNLPPERHELLVKELMAARRAKKTAMHTGDLRSVAAARQRVDRAKHELGERGPVWWTDGAPNENRKLAKNSTYAAWYAQQV